jgi:hypothetical protein
VERKEVRRVKPLLSGLQVPEWEELAKDQRTWRKMFEVVSEGFSERRKTSMIY